MSKGGLKPDVRGQGEVVACRVRLLIRMKDYAEGCTHRIPGRNSDT
jgi:hypothetical protein